MVRYNYDAWGNHSVEVKDETCAQLAELNPFRYRSYYYDVETKLYYLQTRYYDPEVGRFISQDGVEYAEPETINGINLYAYCGNNPVTYVDPTGEFLVSFLIALAAGVIIGGLVGGVTAYAKGDDFFVGFLSGALVGGVLSGVMLLGGAAMLAVAGKAVVGIGILTTFTAKAGFLIGAAAVSYAASVGAGMGTYAIQESMNGREINASEMIRQGINTGLKGLISFGTGMILGAAGAYPNLLVSPKLPLVESIKRAFDLFIHFGIPRTIISFFIQTPWRLMM